MTCKRSHEDCGNPAFYHCDSRVYVSHFVHGVIVIALLVHSVQEMRILAGALRGWGLHHTLAASLVPYLACPYPLR